MTPDNHARLLQYESGPSQRIDFFSGQNVSIQRLDQFKSWASGNKFYKLKDYFSYTLLNNITTLVSKGGMFSNHLDAFVSACHTFGVSCKCIVRSHRQDDHNPSIKRWISQNAEIIYLEPVAYNRFDEHASAELFPHALFIPEGGGGSLGIQGASAIADDLDTSDVTHIVMAGGSMTTSLGLLSVLPHHIKLVIVPAWKNCSQQYLQDLIELNGITLSCSFELWNDYHFGGFGKFTPDLIEFMHGFTKATHIPLDPVYTGKMMYAINEKIHSGYFSPTDRILAIHTGGLQGVAGFAYRFPEAWSSYAQMIRVEAAD